MLIKELVPRYPAWQYLDEGNGDYIIQQLARMFTDKRIFYTRFKAESFELIHQKLFNIVPGTPEMKTQFYSDERVATHWVALGFEDGSDRPYWLTIHEHSPFLINSNKRLPALLVSGKEFPSYAHAMQAMATRDFSSEYETLECWVGIPPRLSPQTLREVLAIPH